MKSTAQQSILNTPYCHSCVVGPVSLASTTTLCLRTSLRSLLSSCCCFNISASCTGRASDSGIVLLLAPLTSVPGTDSQWLRNTGIPLVLLIIHVILKFNGLIFHLQMFIYKQTAFLPLQLQDPQEC